MKIDIDVKILAVSQFLPESAYMKNPMKLIKIAKKPWGTIQNSLLYGIHRDELLP